MGNTSQNILTAPEKSLELKNECSNIGRKCNDGVNIAFSNISECIHTLVGLAISITCEIDGGGKIGLNPFISVVVAAWSLTRIIFKKKNYLLSAVSAKEINTEFIRANFLRKKVINNLQKWVRENRMTNFQK